MLSVAIETRMVSYRELDTPLTGLLCRGEPGPGLLLVPGGAGLDDHARDQAGRYAALGYTVFACDMYGAGVLGDRERMMESLTAMRDDPDVLLRRTRAGLAALAESSGHDGRFAAVGFCFGGLAVLTLARAGEDLAAAVSIHGALATSRPAAPGAVRARLLACHGAADPHVPLADVTAFAEEMNHAGADWQLIMYGGAQHGFTHSRAVPGETPGVAYDPAADARSFAAVRTFLAEAFADHANVTGADPHGESR